MVASLGSDQSLIPSFQVHINSRNNGDLLATPGFVPLTFSRYASVVSATIPIAWYNCVGEYLSFVLTGSSFSEDQYSQYFNFVIPDGNYSITELCAICQYTHADFDVVKTNSYSFGLEYNPNTNKVLLRISNSAQFFTATERKFLLVLDSPFLRRLGFMPSQLLTDIPPDAPDGDYTTYIAYYNKYKTNPYPSLDYTIPNMHTQNTKIPRTKWVAPNIYTIDPHNRWSVQQKYSGIVAQNQVDMSLIRNILVKPSFGMISNAIDLYLAKIPISGNFGDIQQYTNPNAFRVKMFNGETLGNIRLTFTDELTGDEIDFQGSDWSVTLQFDFMKPDPDFETTQKPDPELHADFATPGTIPPDATGEPVDNFNDGTPPENNLLAYADTHPYDISA